MRVSTDVSLTLIIKKIKRLTSTPIPARNCKTNNISEFVPPKMGSFCIYTNLLLLFFFSEIQTVTDRRMRTVI
jgi:hypothetical protein